jgi:DNA-binding IclR family transcriptional regulator
MTGELDLSEDIARSVELLVDSLEGLEVLIMLYRRADKAFTAAEVAAELGLREAAAARELDQLLVRRLVTKDAGASPRYRLVSTSAEGERLEDVRRVAEAYGNRRIAVINHVASRTLTRIRSLADAFRFKKE